MLSDLLMSLVRTDGGTQLREGISETAVLDFAGDLGRGDVFPPVVAFFDGGNYWLADGFHRYFAHLKLLRETIRADVRKGTLREAVLYAAGCNYAGQVRRTHADKRKAILTLLSDAEWFGRTDNWVAEQCHVDHENVTRTRRAVVDGELELLTLSVCVNANCPDPDAPRTGKDGKKYPTTKSRTPQEDEEESCEPPEPEEPPPLPPPPPKDGNGKTIPDELREVFGSRWLFDRALSLLGQFDDALGMAEASVGGRHLRAHSQDARVKMLILRQTLEECRPHSITCPTCRNRDENCKTCSGEFWAPRGKR